MLEAEKAIGGLLNPFHRGPHRFDTGLHYVGACGERGLFRQLLEEVGVDVAMREMDPEGIERIVLPGYEVRMPRGAAAYRDRLVADFPSEREGLDRFFATIHAFGSALPRRVDTLGAEPSALSQGLGVALSRETFAAFLARHVRDPLLVGVLAAQSGNYALPPSRASAFTGLSVLDHYLGGAFYPVGGSGALRDALVSAIRAGGGEIATRQPVERIVVERGRARAVRCASGRVVEADAIVSNVDAATTMLDLIEADALDPKVRDRYARLAASLGSASLYVGARGAAKRLADAGITDANEWWFDDVDPEKGYEDALAGRLGIRQAFFSSPSMKDRSNDGDAQDATLTVLSPAPFAPFARFAEGKTRRRGPAYEALKAEVRAALVARVEARVPGLVASADVIDTSTPVTTRTFVGARLGGSYGPSHEVGQAGLLRGRVRTAIPGLALAGASVFGGGVVWSALSGYVAANAI